MYISTSLVRQKFRWGPSAPDLPRRPLTASNGPLRPPMTPSGPRRPPTVEGRRGTFGAIAGAILPAELLSDQACTCNNKRAIFTRSKSS